MQSHFQTKLNSFAEDVRCGLSAETKFLSSKYFYDDAGSRLFRRIMDLPEYYLTRTESEIFLHQKCEITRAFLAHNKPLDLIELGAGDGAKTAILIDCLLKQKANFRYSPIDISSEALRILIEKFEKRFPKLPVEFRCGDYFRVLDSLEQNPERAKIIFFLGANIGNFNFFESVSFLRQLRAAMNENDLLLIGFDLQKDPRVIQNAYDDAQNMTAAFNMNLLTRINRELGANFDTNKFSHYAEYSPESGAARSFLISGEKQKVWVECLNQEFYFESSEPIFMEISQKYTLETIERLACKSGFQIAECFTDAKNYFADSLWKIL